MTADTTPIDISNMPEMVRLAEEVRTTRKSRILKRDNELIAQLTPVKQRRSSRAKSKADYEAFLSAAGGWKDIDTDTLVANIYAARRQSNRSPVHL